MVDDRRLGTGCRTDGAALGALMGVAERLLVGALGDADALDAHTEACVVHHREHAAHALMLLAEEVTDRAAVVAVLHDTRRTAMNAELVLDAHAGEVVALAERAVVVDEKLRDDEEADALRAGRRTRGPGEHQVHDVVGDIMLTPGDEDLLTEDAPGAVVGRLGLGGEAPTSEPAWGSVRFIVPVHSPLTSFWR